MPKNNSVLKKKKIKIEDDTKTKKKPIKSVDTNKEIKKETIDEKDNKDDNDEIIDDPEIEEENYDDDFGDDKNEIDDEDKEIDTEDKEENENEEEEETAVDLGDDKGDREDKDVIDYDDDKCIYNFADDKSDDEIELVFDDDIVTETSDIIPTNQRRSKPFLFKYERVRLLGDRTQQITLGAKPMIKNTENLTPKQIAELELQNNVIPLIIQRSLPNGKKERWYIKELQH